MKLTSVSDSVHDAGGEDPGTRPEAALVLVGDVTPLAPTDRRPHLLDGILVDSGLHRRVKDSLPHHVSSLVRCWSDFRR